jgi:hypothetical protein
VARRVGVDVLAVEFLRAEGQDEGTGCGHVFDHDVEMELLRDGRVGPGRPAVPGASWNARPDEASLAATTTQSSLW